MADLKEEAGIAKPAVDNGVLLAERKKSVIDPKALDAFYRDNYKKPDFSANNARFIADQAQIVNEYRASIDADAKSLAEQRAAYETRVKDNKQKALQLNKKTSGQEAWANNPDKVCADYLRSAQQVLDGQTKKMEEQQAYKDAAIAHRKTIGREYITSIAVSSKPADPASNAALPKLRAGHAQPGWTK